MKIFVLLEHSHHEIMNADKAFVRSEQVQQYLKSAPGTYCEDEIELVLPEERIGTVEEIVSFYRSLVKHKIELDLMLEDMSESHPDYKKYTDEKKQVELQIEEFGKEKVLRIKEVDEQ
ncbi:hypothetical protein ACQKJG_17875 [Priestia megaterium]|uniref:hypothetical protein n=1 Tax=Priestia megaterium TaxID=1404 RepID=UPI003D0619C4